MIDTARSPEQVTGSSNCHRVAGPDLYLRSQTLGCHGEVGWRVVCVLTLGSPLWGLRSGELAKLSGQDHIHFKLPKEGPCLP